ncbi:putative 28S ribosomal protein S25, mitochondrial [Labeo rohita]|uniref:28S ribosomal protein S25, mitochondrial n=1 Tax=Labeo rohita TaxID=84645 RepID=A0ABQ8MMR9_LABRO|nr:putative 28S ribosomal protein S25, mitochondrial [Labeo rohita]
MLLPLASSRLYCINSTRTEKRASNRDRTRSSAVSRPENEAAAAAQSGYDVVYCCTQTTFYLLQFYKEIVGNNGGDPNKKSLCLPGLLRDHLFPMGPNRKSLCLPDLLREHPFLLEPLLARSSDLREILFPVDSNKRTPNPKVSQQKESVPERAPVSNGSQQKKLCLPGPLREHPFSLGLNKKSQCLPGPLRENLFPLDPNQKKNTCLSGPPIKCLFPMDPNRKSLCLPGPLREYPFPLGPNRRCLYLPSLLSKHLIPTRRACACQGAPVPARYPEEEIILDAFDREYCLDTFALEDHPHLPESQKEHQWLLGAQQNTMCMPKCHRKYLCPLIPQREHLCLPDPPRENSTGSTCNNQEDTGFSGGHQKIKDSIRHFCA